MDLKNKTDDQLLRLLQEARTERQQLLGLESDLRAEINSRSGLPTIDSYPHIKKVSLERLKKLEQFLDHETLIRVLEIIERR